MTHEPDSAGAARELLKLLGGKWISAALSTAASLGLADALHAHDMTAQELAAKLDCSPAMLGRLLGVLAAEGVVEEQIDEGYRLTTLGEQLRTDALGPLAVFVGEPFSWAPWMRLPEAIRTGQVAFEVEHGEGLFDYLSRRPEAAQIYQAGVDAFTRGEAHALARAFDFSEVKKIVDIGGGMGTLLIELLGHWPHLEGVLFDREHVIKAAAPRMQTLSLDGRCTRVGGDFLAGVPEGADIYIVRHVIHNWSDEEATAILRHCAKAVLPGGKVLVVEGILLPGHRKDTTRLLDLEMMVLSGAGRERTKSEFRQLFKAAGLRLTGTRPLADTARILIGES